MAKKDNAKKIGMSSYKFYELGKIIKKKKEHSTFSIGSMWSWAVKYLGYTDQDAFEKEIFDKMYKDGLLVTVNGTADYAQRERLVLDFTDLKIAWEKEFYLLLKDLQITLRDKWISVGNCSFKMSDVYLIRAEEDRLVFEIPGNEITSKRVPDLDRSFLVNLKDFITERINEEDVILTHRV